MKLQMRGFGIDRDKVAASVANANVGIQLKGKLVLAVLSAHLEALHRATRPGRYTQKLPDLFDIRLFENK
jgi:hypothetical protein